MHKLAKLENTYHFEGEWNETNLHDAGQQVLHGALKNELGTKW